MMKIGEMQASFAFSEHISSPAWWACWVIIYTLGNVYILSISKQEGQQSICLLNLTKGLMGQQDHDLFIVQKSKIKSQKTKIKKHAWNEQNYNL